MEVGITSNQESAAGRLARIFPGATPMRIPVRLERKNGMAENTAIEFGTGQEFIFHTEKHLRFDEVVRLRNHNGSIDLLVRIVASYWIDARQIVAARAITQPGAKQ